MSDLILQIGPETAAAYPVELLELDLDGTERQLARGDIPVAAIDQQELATLLTGNVPPVGLQGPGTKLCGAVVTALGAPLVTALASGETSIFLDIGSPDLRRLPWEVLVWPKPTPGGAVPTQLIRSHHLSRVFDPDWQVEKAIPDGPLRMLIVIGAALDDTDVDALAELSAIRRSLQPVQRTIDIEVVESWDELYPKLRSFLPHVLHFIGHGTAEPPCLIFAKKGSVAARDWLVSDISADVGAIGLNHWKPCLAFLNACRSGAGSSELAPVSDAFLANGARATIAMQGNIKGAAAGELAGAFYGAIARGLSIDQALSLARVDIGVKHSRKEASYPALTLRCRPGRVFPTFERQIADYEARAQWCVLLPKLTVFVDQKKPRRDLCERLWPFRQGQLRQSFILLRGETGFGKTVLSTWLLDLTASLGHHVRYVCVGASPSEGVDATTILEKIWGGVQPPSNRRSPLLDSLSLEPEEKLRELLAGTKDPSVLYPAFRSALARLAAKAPVTLVLDELNKRVELESFWILWEHLFVPLSTKEVPNVNLILVLDDEDYTFYRVAERLDQHPELSIPNRDLKLEQLPPKELLENLDEYLALRHSRFCEPIAQPLIVGIRQYYANAFEEGRVDLRNLSIAWLEEKAKELARVIELDLERPRL
jgi:hypothetical protein